VTLVLTNTDVRSLLTMRDCIDALEQGYKALALGRAVEVPRTDMMFPTKEPDTFYMFKCIQGGMLDQEVVGQRNQSDFDHFYREGNIEKVANHREIYPSNVFLYSMKTLELLAIVHDGELQRMRVAGACAVAAKYMANEESRVLGLYGAGFQATSMIEALRAVRPIKEVRVYSPTRGRQIKFCKEMSEKHGIEVIPVDTPQQVPRGADIVACATNVVSSGGVCKGEWLQSGTHLTSIKFREFDDAAYRKCDRIFYSGLTEDFSHFYSLYTPPEIKVPEKSNRMEGDDQSFYKRYADKMHNFQSLLINEARGRASNAETNLFMKGMGTGVEFTATANRVYDLARAHDKGETIRNDLFLQRTHSPWSTIKT
jgi:alanine dehydrogenase